MGTQMTGQTGKKALAVSWTTLPTINCTLPGTDILSMHTNISAGADVIDTVPLHLKCAVNTDLLWQVHFHHCALY